MCMHRHSHRRADFNSVGQTPPSPQPSPPGEGEPRAQFYSALRPPHARALVNPGEWNFDFDLWELQDSIASAKDFIGPLAPLAATKNGQLAFVLRHDNIHLERWNQAVGKTLFTLIGAFG